MPLAHRHPHPPRDLFDAVGEMMDRVKRGSEAPDDLGRRVAGDLDETVDLVKKDPQNGQNNGGNGGNGGGGGGDQDGGIPTAIVEPTQTNNLGTEIAKATGEATLSPTDNIAGDRTMSGPTNHPTGTSSSGSSSSADGDADPVSLSPGATAGIIFGVLGGVLLIGLLIFLAFSRRKSNKSSPENASEKFTSVDLPPPPPSKDLGSAPRLSLRPITQFFPNFNMDKRSSKSAAMSLNTTTTAGAAAGAYGRSTPSPNPFDRPGTSQSAHPSNPFGAQAERAPSLRAEERGMYASPYSPPTPDRTTKPPGGRQTSMYKKGLPEGTMDLTLPSSARPPSPTGTVFSMTSVATGSGPTMPSVGADAIAAAGGPRNTTVHRVQLDFKPSLADEMELRGGDLVRLLHEYDDGWALCIKLDRSQQGVVPRTCLSTRPVKPRLPPGAPRGPPVNPQGAAPGAPYGAGAQRPMTPRGRSESPMRPAFGPTAPSASPGGFRTQSPMGRSMSPAGSSRAPGSRSQSPNPWSQGPSTGRPRAPSNPHGPSPMNPGYGQGPPPGLAL